MILYYYVLSIIVFIVCWVLLVWLTLVWNYFVFYWVFMYYVVLYLVLLRCIRLYCMLLYFIVCIIKYFFGDYVCLCDYTSYNTFIEWFLFIVQFLFIIRLSQRIVFTYDSYSFIILLELSPNKDRTSWMNLEKTYLLLFHCLHWRHMIMWTH